ncbi:MAG: hypothetical protein QM820_15885 [Minicystis sp.]
MRIAVLVEPERRLPGVGQRLSAEHRPGHEHRGERRGRGRLVIEGVVVHHRPVGRVELTALHIPMIDARIVIPRVVLGGDEVDPIHAVRRILEIAIDVPDVVLALREPAGVFPGVALVRGDQHVRAAPVAAGEVVDPVLGREIEQVRVCRVEIAVDLRGPVEGQVRPPRRAVVRLLGDPVSADLVAVVVGVHRQIAAVRADEQRWDVVIVLLDVIERDPLARALGDVVGHQIDVTVAIVAGGHRSDEHRAVGLVDDDPLVLVPAPAAVVVEDDDRALRLRRRGVDHLRRPGPAGRRR